MEGLENGGSGQNDEVLTSSFKVKVSGDWQRWMDSTSHFWPVLFINGVRCALFRRL